MISGRGPGELVAFGLAAPGPRPGAVLRMASLQNDLFAEAPAWKALSLWQPYAALVARGVKLHLTMHQPTTYRGPLAIHAARVVDLAGAPDALCVAALGAGWRDALPARAIVAVAELADCRPAHDVRDLTLAEQAAGVFAAGRWSWALSGVRALRRPIPMAGRQGLFGWHAPDDLEHRLGQVLDPIALSRDIGWGFTRRRVEAPA